MKIIDHDKDGKQVKIRLAAIDCPEKGQSCTNAAKNFTAKLVSGKLVKIWATDTDRYGRNVAFVYVGDKNLNKELLSAGLASLSGRMRFLASEKIHPRVPAAGKKVRHFLIPCCRNHKWVKYDQWSYLTHYFRVTSHLHQHGHFAYYLYIQIDKINTAIESNMA